MQQNVIFVIGSPRSGSTMLQKMLGSHPDIFTHPEPHLVTPLAHLGWYATVDKAPYDHINASVALKEFIEELPGGEQDYCAACAAYLDVLYGRMLASCGKRYFLDKTPAYALVLPFLTRVYPAAKYVVLTRHPLAIFTSYADSFFDGDVDAAVAYNDVVGRYVPAIAAFLRDAPVPYHHVRYEDLVQDPQTHLRAIFDFLDLPDCPDAVDYGKHRHIEKSHGDPKAKQHTRPTTASVHRWASVLAADPHKRAVAQQVVDAVDPDDFSVFGYPKEGLFDPVAQASADSLAPDRRWRWNSFRLKRKIFLALKKDIHRRPHGKVIKAIKYYCDVLLRE